MEIKKIGSRGLVFSFYDLGIVTNVSSIITKDCFFIIDTYLGPDIMKEIESFLLDKYGDRKFVIINTHSDWDHIWGNCYFENTDIISHASCYEEILKYGEIYLDKYREYHRGEVEIKFPNITFDRSITYRNESIHIYHSPGHSKDSISVIDEIDRVIYVGDNIESPIPYIQDRDLNTYMGTLEAYLDLDIDTFIGGHTGIVDRKLVEDNLKYVRALYNREIINTDNIKDIHLKNIEFLYGN